MDESTQELIDRLKSAIETVNECSSRLAQENIFAHIGTKSKVKPLQGDNIELRDVILHKSLISEGTNGE